MTLTLEQVKEAGRFAEWGGDFGRPVIEYWPEVEGFGLLARGIGPESYWQGDEMPTTGWHHLPGCDCRFCGEGK